MSLNTSSGRTNENRQEVRGVYVTGINCGHTSTVYLEYTGYNEYCISLHKYHK